MQLLFIIIFFSFSLIPQISSSYQLDDQREHPNWPFLRITNLTNLQLLPFEEKIIKTLSRTSFSLSIDLYSNPFETTNYTIYFMKNFFYQNPEWRNFNTSEYISKCLNDESYSLLIKKPKVKLTNLCCETFVIENVENNYGKLKNCSLKGDYAYYSKNVIVKNKTIEEVQYGEKSYVDEVFDYRNIFQKFLKLVNFFEYPIDKPITPRSSDHVNYIVIIKNEKNENLNFDKIVFYENTNDERSKFEKFVSDYVVSVKGMLIFVFGIIPVVLFALIVLFVCVNLLCCVKTEKGSEKVEDELRDWNIKIDMKEKHIIIAEKTLIKQQKIKKQYFSLWHTCTKNPCFFIKSQIICFIRYFKDDNIFLDLFLSLLMYIGECFCCCLCYRECMNAAHKKLEKKKRVTTPWVNCKEIGKKIYLVVFWIILVFVSESIIEGTVYNLASLPTECALASDIQTFLEENNFEYIVNNQTLVFKPQAEGDEWNTNADLENIWEPGTAFLVTEDYIVPRYEYFFQLETNFEYGLYSKYSFLSCQIGPVLDVNDTRPLCITGEKQSFWIRTPESICSKSEVGIWYEIFFTALACLFSFAILLIPDCLYDWSVDTLPFLLCLYCGDDECVCIDCFHEEPEKRKKKRKRRSNFKKCTSGINSLARYSCAYLIYFALDFLFVVLLLFVIFQYIGSTYLSAWSLFRGILITLLIYFIWDFCETLVKFIVLLKWKNADLEEKESEVVKTKEFHEKSKKKIKMQLVELTKENIDRIEEIDEDKLELIKEMAENNLQTQLDNIRKSEKLSDDVMKNLDGISVKDFKIMYEEPVKEETLKSKLSKISSLSKDDTNEVLNDVDEYEKKMGVSEEELIEEEKESLLPESSTSIESEVAEVDSSEVVEDTPKEEDTPTVNETDETDLL